MRRELTTIRTYLKTRSAFVKINKTWRHIHEQHGIGQIDEKNGIWFSREEREFLRGLFIHETGLDPLSTQKLPETRMEAAVNGRNEKLATAPVFSDTVRCARADGTAIRTLKGDALCPPGSFINISSASLSLQEEIVIIIENGALFSVWEQIKLPAHLSNALLIYRGHDSTVSVLTDMLQRTPPKLNVGFYDFDPAGLLMGITNNHDDILIPSNYAKLKEGSDLFDSVNQEKVFWKQGEQMSSLMNTAPDQLLPVVKHMEQYRIAIMQEHIVTREISLGLAR